MHVCPSCGREVAGDFVFCPQCGARLGVPAPTREQRKTVTVLFCDVTGSTSLGESVDPEALRALLARYFERMKGIVEHHGGSVEKFIGDAVMAVFGVPQVHEDDALRAVRAAAEMRDALPELGLRARIGVNTGEVVAGTEERLATGDAVNVAARLEQAAPSGEVFVGEATLALVGAAVDVEPAAPLELKGKAQPVPAYRLVAVHEAPKRRHESRFVGRENELATLVAAWQRVQGEQECELVTVVGDAGVGKSRLVEEFVSAIETRVVSGRCLPYGEGITYWPVVEVVKQLDARPSDPAAAAALRSLLGETEQGTSADEIAWGFRKLLEEQAPLVCLFDDIHWGEETFLDLVEHVALLSTGVPILLLCLARSDLGERRPQWPITLRLEPLTEPDAAELISDTVPAELRTKIARAAGGNPLFLTEMLAIAYESEGEVIVPPTLQALLAARLDELETAERSVLERGAIEGEIFHRGAVQALSPERPVTPRLAALVRKQLIRPEKSQLLLDDAFSFRHLLIRDTAYDALPKATRAELHQRFADWLEERERDLVELDEILGHHLEQAARYKQELRQPDAKLAERAGDRLAAAGRRALWRSDVRAAVSLLERALELTRPIRVDVALELDLASALTGRRSQSAIAEAVADQAGAIGDHAGEAAARACAEFYRFDLGEGSIDNVERLAHAALPLLEEAGDHANLVHVWDVLGFGVATTHGRFEEFTRAEEEMLRHARLAGQRRAGLFSLPAALGWGPRPADEALRTIDALAPAAPHPGLVLSRAYFLAMLARFDEARPLTEAASERLRELTGDDGPALGTVALVTEFAGDYDAAARLMRRYCDSLENRGRRASLSTYAPVLGRYLCVLGRHDAAEPLARLGRELGDEQDVITQALWRQVQARVYASRGEHREAEELAGEAVAIAKRTDGLNMQGDALCDLAEVLAAAGRPDEAAAALEQALDRYERKKNLAMAGQVRQRLTALRS
jgi:class 3 adenylate cyclase/tetratricopeptide (TPR) repeat protein